MSPAPVDGFYLPPALEAGVETAVQRFGPPHDAVEIRLPIVAPQDVTRWIAALRQARAEHLAQRPIASILRPLERVVARFLDPKDRARRLLVQTVAVCGRFSAPMVERALDDAFEPLARGGFRKWIASELGAVSALDEPAATREGVLRRATGPEWMLQIYAGNVPTVPVWPLFSALLLKSALFAKTSAQEPLLAPLLARAIAEEDAELGACVAVVWWKGGTAELERAALAAAPAVLAFGGDHAIASIARQLRPDAKVVLHGPKVSLAYIGRGALGRAALPGLARQVAQDVALYDQQGCLSPHAVYVERGAPVTPVDFAAALGEALEAASTSLPRREPTASEAASVQLYRAQARFEASGDPKNRVLASGSGTSWTVICESGARFEPGPAQRAVRVHSIAGAEEFERAVGPSIRFVEALAVEERGPRRAALAARFAGLGIPRIASAGALQRPSPLGTHGGVRRLSPFVTWSTVERSKGAGASPRAPVKKASRPSRKGSKTRARPRRRSR
ncbi:MAG TPA: acyl-CoA reductase [Candidatus Limnocylindrales bacterium]|nr:acyl-CoA reductase [Candidatus Limnocylindrales bacterium]